ncbi:hypothetical protein SAMN05216302_102920 [Nitrosomonas aestuarii]|uniref:Uncharacterized protein n=1 Tax=Nitrosomonas aestuarii TaxID=52441 RepID=A0A1I4EMI9_9PROT|nr:hypothetical protein SAMN05216302_102920 [Nitrosomonas aestuarii]
MSDEADLKRKKLKTALILLITVIAIYIGAFFFNDV